uniref:Ribonuclease H-like domain, reverse transcriptase, RNA-dependent DNA polymerase n=1 Tax=Tanacetum cinerariifolium TaxID=118510 RepID=A0A6L2K1X2_TANCI|nr:ribonuclease H-like domain, reverse transcriptase, RNA-dependent DNA polymerase [Tanacetum cinerariifolium]
MSTTRCMMKRTNMPQNFWAEAVRYAIYILNSVLTKALDDITPYETIKQRKPNLENLRVFGCIAYAKVPSQRLTKLDDRSSRMTKKDANGNIIKHKARLVAKGNIQEHGIDFEEAFAPVARLKTIRLLLAIAANNKWEVHHLDVKFAFLHGYLKEEVYVTQPEGFINREDNGKVYRLIKALCGLRQAPYDLIILGTPKKEIDKFKAQMEEKFKMSDQGLLAYYLGIEVTQTSGDISIKQTAYANKILKEAGMIEFNETLIPMDTGTRLPKIKFLTMRQLIGLKDLRQSDCD